MLRRLPVLVLIATCVYGQAGEQGSRPAAPAQAADRLTGSTLNADERYRAWQNMQSRVYAELRNLKDPCDNEQIARLMDPLKKQAKAALDSRALTLSAYSGERARMADDARTNASGAEQLLGSFELSRSAQTLMLSDSWQRLRSLPPDAAPARQALERAISMQEEHLAKLAPHTQARARIGQSQGLAQKGFDTQQGELKEQQSLLGTEEKLWQMNYDTQISKFALSCVATALGEAPPRAPAPAKPKPRSPVRKK